MKANSVIKLAFMNVKQNSFKRNIFVIVMVLFLLITLVPFCVYAVFKRNAKMLESDNFMKSVIINDYTKKEKEYVESLKKFVAVYDGNPYLSGNISQNESINLRPLINYHSPKGEYNLENGEMLCPNLMVYGDFSFTKSKELKKVYIGDKFQLYFKDANTKYNFSINELYDADDYFNYNTCYINKEYFDILFSKYFNDNNELYILMDTHENASRLAKCLKDYNIDAFVSELDDDFMDPLLKYSVVILIVVSLVSVIAHVLYINLYYKNEYQRLALYRALGYSDKEINGVLIIEVIILLFISLVISLGLYFIIKLVIEYFIHINAADRAIKIVFPYLTFIGYFILLIILSLIITTLNSKKLKKITFKNMEIKG